MWFERLTGFRETDVDDVAAQFVVDGDYLVSRVNDRRMRYGRFETPTLDELRQRCSNIATRSGRLRVREVVGNVQTLHGEPANTGACFQVASQFNTLEMVSPSVTPDDGIDRYEHDHTQGPACAIACGAGTIYRNYLVRLDGRVGQSADHQVNCLADLAARLAVEIEVRNGYALPTAAQLDAIHDALADGDEVRRDALMGYLRIGLQCDTEVTLDGAAHTVTQAYCSALPIAYMPLPASKWAPFGQLVLDAAYEATLATAALNADRTGNRTVYLTRLGGGAFGNPDAWIAHAIERALRIFADADLDVAMVSYGGSGGSERHRR